MKRSSSSEVSGPWMWFCIIKVAFTCLGTGLATPLGSDKKDTHLLLSLPHWSYQKMPLCIIYRDWVGLQFCFFLLFSLATIQHNCTQASFEVCLVEAELKIFVYFAVLWQLAATEMRHVKWVPQKEVSNLQVQTKVEETNLLCSCSVLCSLLIFSHLRIFNFPNWENVTLQLRRKGKIKSRILSFSAELC